VTTVATTSRALGPAVQGKGAWWRRQPPVYSPVSVAALWAGARALVSEWGGVQAREALVARLKECYGAGAVILTDSGTTALRSAFAAILRERPAAAVALPAFACYDLATAAVGADAPVLLYDVDPHTLAPDLDSLRGALRRGAAVVVVVHQYGYPVDLTDVNRLAADAGALVIEDAAQANGATLGDRPVGAQASLGVLSFGRGKGWTGGGGGALLAFDAAAARVIAGARTLLGAPGHGAGQLMALSAQFALARPTLYALPAALPFLRLGQTVYRHPRPPRAAAAASCAAALATWALVADEIAARRRHAERLLVALHGRSAFEPIRAARGARPGYLRLPVLATRTARRAAGEARALRLGVSPGYPRALSDLAGFAVRVANRDAVFSGSRLLAERLCTLPTHSRLSNKDLAEVVSWVQSVGDGA